MYTILFAIAYLYNNDILVIIQLYYTTVPTAFPAFFLTVQKFPDRKIIHLPTSILNKSLLSDLSTIQMPSKKHIAGRLQFSYFKK